MITHLERKTARMYANLKEPTKFEKRQLVILYFKLNGTRREYEVNESMQDNWPLVFNAFLTEAIKHFKDKPELT